MIDVPRLANRLRDITFVRPLESWWRRRMRGRVACLLYHRVGDPGDEPFLTRGGSPVIPADELERDLSFLLTVGARFGTFADLRSGWFPSPDEIGVIITFDDGFRFSYGPGLDALNRAGVPGVVFQSTAMIGAGTLLWEHALYWYTRDEWTAARFRDLVEAARPDLALPTGRDVATFLRKRVPGPEVEDLLAEARSAFGDGDEQAAMARRIYPTAEEVKGARERGHEIGAHGDRHYRRDTIDDAAFEADLARSVEALTRILGAPPGAYSYPFNSYLPGDDAIVGRHFEQAATVAGRPIERDADPLWLPRFTWPGPPRNALRRRRWLLTGRI